MDQYDNEINILKHFSESSGRIIKFPAIKNRKILKITKNWKCWYDNSKNVNNPPDFINDKDKLLLEIMRVDDTTNSKGKSAIRQHEDKIRKMVKEKLHLENDENLYIMNSGQHNFIADKDFSYKKYKQEFTRVINKHKNRILKYREKRDGYKIIFLIMDESSFYIDYQDNEIPKNIKPGDKIVGCAIHKWWLDKSFIDCIKNCGADYVIWWTPYKNTNSQFTNYLPETVFLKVSSLRYYPKTIKYEENKMVCGER